MNKKNPSSFSVLTIFICLSIIGFSFISKLNIQLTPSRALPSIHITYNWNDVSAKIIEKEITSKLEGVFNTVKGIKDISSISDKNYGAISIQFKKNVNIDAVRFEIANLIRQTYPQFPNGVSYPQISMSSANESTTPILSYSIQASSSPHFIKNYAEDNILPKLSKIKGVNKVNIYGVTPFEWQIKYNSNSLEQLQLSVDDLQLAIRNYLTEQHLGNIKFGTNDNSNFSLSLSFKPEEDINWGIIPIKKIGERVILLGNIATTRYKEAKTNNYYRINGLNSINMIIYSEKGVNSIDLAKKLKTKIAQLKNELDFGYNIILTQDSTQYINDELDKIKTRTFFSILILLLLILVIYRSLKYLVVLSLSILTNLLIATIFYYVFNLELHLYSFAGITISFGIIIDNSIIMIDHIKNKGNIKVFLAVLAATLTTIGSLTIIFFLDKSQQANLIDFTLIIAINLIVSLLTSLYFIPAVLATFNIDKKRIRFNKKTIRIIFKLLNKYKETLSWLCKPIFKFALIMALLLGFGIPLHLFPTEIKSENYFSSLYNNCFGNETFSKDVRPTLEKVLGGTLRLFTEDVFENSYDSAPEQTKIVVKGSMPNGCTIEQLNNVIAKFEAYLQTFNEILLFETQIHNHRDSKIIIYFKKDQESQNFPHTLKKLLEAKAISLGGVEWSIEGVGKGFSNAIGASYRQNRIKLRGYDYDKLYNYAEQLKKLLIENSNSRIKDKDIDITSGGWNNNLLSEYRLNFDTEKLTLNNISQTQLYNCLQKKIHSNQLSTITQNNKLQNIKLISDQSSKTSIWDIKNDPIVINNHLFKLGQLASIKKTKTGNAIKKENQQYSLTVAYNFLGTIPLANRIKERVLEKFTPTLPIGYKVIESTANRWKKEDKTQYYYLFIVIGIIFIISSILLESIRHPFIIISLLPISFIGVFLTFYLFEFNFDQGGYASFILLCGISVNSALYIINDFENLKKKFPSRSIETIYFKALSQKVIPIALTIVSTIVGLIPFVWDGQNEPFWFSFAVGSIGGLIFSLIGLFLYLPLFTLKKTKT